MTRIMITAQVAELLRQRAHGLRMAPIRPVPGGFEIDIDSEVLAALEQLRGDGESYSDVILRVGISSYFQ